MRYQSLFNQRTEFRRSLGTSERTQAKRRARIMVAAFDQVFLEADEIMSKKNRGINDELIIKFDVDFDDGRPKRARTEIDATPEEVAALGDALPRAIHELHRAEALTRRRPDTQEATAADLPTLSDTLAEFCRINRWKTPTTSIQYRATVGMLIEIIGDKTLDAITKADARRFRDVAARLPANLKRVRQKHAGLTLEQIADLPGLKPISESTLHHHITRINAVVSWAINNYDGIHDNVFRGVTVQRPSLDDRRDPIPAEDLPKLFNCYLYNDEPWPDSRQGAEPSKFWVPLILAFTGARLNEVAQLHVADVREEQGVWIFDFCETRGTRKRIKQRKPRIVPIHRQLLKAGIREFVAQQVKAGNDRIFPELNYTDKDGYARQIGEFIRQLLQKLEVRGTAHCLRHNVSNALRQADVRREEIQAILGHSVQNMTDLVYGGPYPARLLKKAINKIDYPGLPAAGFSYRRFVSRVAVAEKPRRRSRRA